MNTTLACVSWGQAIGTAVLITLVLAIVSTADWWKRWRR